MEVSRVISHGLVRLLHLMLLENLLLGKKTCMVVVVVVVVQTLSPRADAVLSYTVPGRQ
jgi:hypothetical protein